MTRPHRKYLEGRKFDPDALERKYGLLGTGYASGNWNWRVVFPIRDGADQIVAWQGRSIGEAAPKYKLSNDKDCLEDPRGMLYGLQDCSGDTIIIVEGATGVWRLGPGTVATLGIDWNVKQANKLRRFHRRFILYDPESLAQHKARQIAEHLAQFPGETEVLSGFETDPGEFPDELVRQIRQEIGV